MGSLRNTLHLLILFAVFKTIQSHPKDIATEETADYLNLNDEILLNEEDETVEDDNTFDATKSEDTADFSDLNDLVNNEKRGTCYDRGSKTYCKLVRIRGDCRSRLYRARSASRRCVKSCGICYG
ncbi:antimicrobial peptide AmAMP1-like isoform X1 [Montipora capricornis]|uniref:antimicrobial peptide AmAMP1-like isoform X1 n=1 Tax=Montipora capricornis TaxID=246305 RepID=UPI0035F1FAA3